MNGKHGKKCLNKEWTYFIKSSCTALRNCTVTKLIIISKGQNFLKYIEHKKKNLFNELFSERRDEV